MTEPTLKILPPDGVRSDAHIATQLGADLGYPADPWQYDLIDAILQERENGLYAAPVFGFSLARRNGKSFVAIIITLYRMLVCDDDVIYTAHHSTSADAFFSELLDIFEQPELAEHVESIKRREGKEGIYLHGGGSFRIVSRAEGKDPGRGLKCDLLLFDESLDITESSLTSLEPMNLNSANPQTIFLGSPSYEDKPNGKHFRQLRQNAMRGDNPRLGWISWEAPGEADIHDPEVWRACNPAMSSATPRITEETLAAKASSTPRKKFLTEYLGSWSSEVRPTVVDMDHWDLAKDYTAKIPQGARMVWAIDAANDSSSSTIVASAELESGKRYVEKVARLSGIGWVSQKVIDNCKAFPQIERVIIDAKGPLAHYADEWRKAGVPVVVTDYNYLADAAVSFVQSTEDQSYKHQGDGELEKSVRSAAVKPLAGRYKFVPYDMSDPDCDITGLVAMSLALYAFKSDKAVSKTKKPKTNTVTIGGKTYTR